MKTNYSLIGIMSGTSLDGMDISYTNYTFENNCWSFELKFCKTFSYTPEITEILSKATKLTAVELIQLDKKIGQLFGEFVLEFQNEFSIKNDTIDAIASHGHTIFHQPDKGFTYQIGCGTTISILTELPVINDFRTKDVVLGGQGAPLVPVGDFGLFQSIADGFLNIGGISNISFQKNNKVYAYDISPGNLPLNILIQSIGKNYDNKGELAASGKVNQILFEQLNNLEFYTKNGPKSLGIEWITNEFTPKIDLFEESLANKLATICEHIAFQIGRIANSSEIQKLLITGGGALNKHLINRINHYFSGQIEIPETKIIEFKEAIVFGFLGALYLTKQNNCLKEVTGARRNSCSGVLHLPN